MSQLTTFISQKFRPDVRGGRLDKTHVSHFQLDSTKESEYLRVNAICFGPKKDNVLINLEHMISKNDQILVFYYEDIHHRWTHIYKNDESFFLYKKNDNEQYKIKANTLYIRGCYVEPSDLYWTYLGDFYNFLEIYDGYILCHPRKQIPNESKLFQLNNSLKKALQDNRSISIGRSFVIKGNKGTDLLNSKKSYIVKSLSGVRSIVVGEDDYKKWNQNDINSIPVLFQEKIEGHDLRIHILNNKLFAKRSHIKKNIDYRYDDNFFKLSDVEKLTDQVTSFCKIVAFEEDNLLLGIDFIQTEDGYVALEANPSPGWSAYHPHNGINPEPFVIELLRVLTRD